MNQLSPEDDKQTQSSKRKISSRSVPPHINPERLRQAKIIVDHAVKTHKVFSVQGSYPIIRKSLKARGWVEQYMPRPKVHTHMREIITPTDVCDSDSDDSVEYDREQDSLCSLMSCMLRNEVVYFYWTNRKNAIDPKDLLKDQITNHFKNTWCFTTKVGLCMKLRNLPWFVSANPDTFFPRCYRLGVEDEKHAFIEDYRRTACFNLLKYILQKEECNHNDQTLQDNRKQCKQSQTQLLPEMINFALNVCKDFLGSLEHSDIDCWETTLKPTNEQWADFLQNYYLIVHNGLEIRSCDLDMNSCSCMLQRLRAACPQIDIDGTDNMWIIKPGAMSRGRGILCAKRLEHILRVVHCDPTIIRDSKWVAQKYIEKPFLVLGTKFDVRQWFLVTDWNPLTVWFYTRCYLRFSTQPFSLHTMDSSVHLCNNSIQRHFRPSELRHPAIPKHNMWFDDDFRAFLMCQGREYQWETVVVPEMKKAVIYALLTAQDDMEPRKNTFELYGADFILDHDLHPWLIEINTSPTMASSTPVTAHLCKAVQEDTIRVVLDQRADPTADTGDFEMIYRQAAITIPQYLGVNLLVEGAKIKVPGLLPPYVTRTGKKHRTTDKVEK